MSPRNPQFGAEIVDCVGLGVKLVTAMLAVVTVYALLTSSHTQKKKITHTVAQPIPGVFSAVTCS